MRIVKIMLLQSVKITSLIVKNKKRRNIVYIYLGKTREKNITAIALNCHDIFSQYIMDTAENAHVCSTRKAVHHCIFAHIKYKCS